jgi:hypothetical protein
MDGITCKKSHLTLRDPHEFRVEGIGSFIFLGKEKPANPAPEVRKRPSFPRRPVSYTHLSYCELNHKGMLRQAQHRRKDTEIVIGYPQDAMQSVIARSRATK